MKYTRHSKSGLFLIELIITILFFSVVSAVCIQMFALSHIKSTQSRDLINAVNKAENVAACIKSGNNAEEKLENILGLEKNNSSYEAYFDSWWKKTSSAPVYRLSVEIDNSLAVTTANIAVEKLSIGENEEIYSLVVSNYQK